MSDRERLAERLLAEKHERPVSEGWRVVLNTLRVQRWWSKRAKRMLIEDVEYLRGRVIELEAAALLREPERDACSECGATFRPDFLPVCPSCGPLTEPAQEILHRFDDDDEGET